MFAEAAWGLTGLVADYESRPRIDAYLEHSGDGFHRLDTSSEPGDGLPVLT